MDDCGCEYGMMYKGGVKGLDVGGYVSLIFNMWKRYGVNNKQ